MTVVVSFKGSGIAAIDPTLKGSGQGLQVGKTVIDFAKGQVQLTAVNGNSVSMGSFAGLSSLGSDNYNVKSFIFRSKAICTVLVGKASYDYKNLNEWVTFNYLSVESVEIDRTATGQNPDVFDYQFFASDDPQFAFTIQQASRDSESEILFSNAERDNVTNPLGLGAGVYAVTSNLRGAKKIKLSLVTNVAGAETGTVDVSLEHFDTTSGLWLPTLQATDAFGVNIPRNKLLVLDVGDDMSQPPASGDNSYNVSSSGGSLTIQQSKNTPTGVGIGGIIAMVPTVGTLLPSGDNIFRIKCIVKVSTLTFSLGIIKVFD